MHIRALVLCALVLAACGGDVPTGDGSTPARSGVPAVGVTSSVLSGSRLVEGAGDVGEPVSLGLEGVAEWLVAVPVDDGVAWVVAFDDGRARGFLQSGDSLTEFPIAGRDRPGPISLVADEAGVRVPVGPPGASSLSAPLVVDGRTVSVLSDGTLAIDDDRLDVHALPDSTVAVSGDGLAAVVSDPTDRYAHGILGDGQEAATITVVDLDAGRVTATIPAPEGMVFEAVGVMWADVDGNGSEEILATASNDRVGAELVAFSASGTLRFRTEPIGQGGRWRHQISVGPFGPEGEIEVVDVLTPHIGGVLRFFRADRPVMERAASLPGFGSHGIFSRNLDMAVAFDVDGDGSLEVVVPSQDQRALSAVGRSGETAEVTWTFELGDRLVSNLQAVTADDGRVSMGAVAGDRLLVWP